MGGAAQVSSIDAIRQFAAAVVKFQEEARLCLSVLDSQLRQILFWLERDRPMFWKREVENCMRELADARVRLHQCRLRRTGDFRPSCIEEVKALEKAKKDIEFAQMQVPTVKRWHAEAAHEANEYHGRASQIVQSVERDIPRLLALLSFTIDRLEAYAAVTTPNAAPDRSFFETLSADLQTMLNRTSTPEATPAVESDSPVPDEDSTRDS
jgi:hypothetical protein